MVRFPSQRFFHRRQTQMTERPARTNSQDMPGARLVIGIICSLLSAVGVSGAQPGTQANTPTGTWRGQSRCLVKGSACKDEDSIYRIAAVPHSPTKVTLTANKIVDGQEVNMGTSDCSFSKDTRVVKCPLPNGSNIRFELKADSLNGTMILSDGTAWRKITLRRVPANPNPSRTE